MATSRSVRLELRVTPAQKEMILRNASLRGKTLTDYAVELLVGGPSSAESVGGALGWMRGTATIVGDIVGPTEPDGWEPGEL